MGRKTKSRRILNSGKRRMKKVKGKFREAKKYTSIKKKIVKRKVSITRKVKLTKPKVDRTKKKSLIKNLRDLAKAWEKENEGLHFL